MNTAHIAARTRQCDELSVSIQKRLKDAETKGYRSKADMDAIEADVKTWQAETELLKSEKARAKAADDLMGRMRGNGANQAGHDSVQAKTVGRWNPPSPLTLPAQAYAGLYEAAAKRLPSYRVEFSGKDGVSEATVKSPFAEGSFTSGGLPRVLMPQLTQGLLYEPDRIFSHFIGATAPEAAAVEWIQHTGNANPAAPVAELGTKPDLGLQLTTHTTTFTKIAALASVSTEALHDFQTFLSFVPVELQHAITDAETAQVIGGDGTGANMTGILHTAGTLTRVHPTTGETPLDTLAAAFNDIRVGNAYATADLVIMHANLWNSLRTAKDSYGRYLLAADPAHDALNTVWGVKVITNTKVPDGTAVVFDTSKAVLAWTRMGLALEINAYGSGMWEQNYVSFRAEERVAIGVQRPTAVNIVTGFSG
jgi:Phage capsid family